MARTSAAEELAQAEIDSNLEGLYARRCVGGVGRDRRRRQHIGHE